jgi:selenocysteine lyase/cysteine desulfurase
VGVERIERHVGGLVDSMLARVSASEATVITPTERSRRAGIVTIRVQNPTTVSERLADAGVVCSLRESAIRLSPHLYSTRGDIDRVVDVLGL